MVNRRHERLGLRYSNVFVFLAGLAGVAIVLALLLWQLFPPSPFRTTVLLAGNPMLVASWDGARRHVTVIEFPASVAVTGVVGVGEYSLESLWRLGELDPKDRALLADSLGETLAVAIPWYIGPRRGDLPDQPSAETSVRSTFSIGNLLPLIMGRYRSNISFQTFLPLALATQKLRTDAFDELRIAAGNSITQKELPDGTKIDLIDQNRLDVVVGTRLEEEAVRRESLRVMIFNTTATPILGRRMERRVSRAGALVVGIGNDSPTVGRCIVSGSKEKTESTTAFFFKQYFGCETNTAESIRSDLELRVGREFENLFLSPSTSLPLPSPFLP